ncbi:hypothetical protein MHAS44199_07945 [Mycolicibacterium hassiacum DSM 44199]|nr:hypothetical protein [Mycolicibacterium hassiacum DSM 44199]
MAGVVQPALAELRVDRIGGGDHRFEIVGDQHREHAPEELPRRLASGDHRGQGLRVGQPHEHVSGVHRGEDQGMHLAAPPVGGVGEHPQIAKIDLALHPGITIGDPYCEVLAAETATLAGESMQCPVRHHTALPTQQGVDLGHRQRPLLWRASHPGSDLILEPQKLLPRRPVAIRAHRTHRFGDQPDQAVINRAGISVAAQTGPLGGLDIAPHRLAVQAAMRGDRAIARRRQPRDPQPHP